MARVQYSDVVINESGRPIAGVVVSIIPVVGSGGTSKLWELETGAAELSQVITNAHGVFSVWLDEGRYDVDPAGTSTKRVEIISETNVSYGRVSVGNYETVQKAIEALPENGGTLLFSGTTVCSEE